MNQAIIIDFLKEIAVGYKSAKSYPAGHPVMEKVIDSTMAQLLKVYNELPTFSTYFLEQTIIFQDLRIDVTRNAAVQGLLEALTKNGINSLTFEAGVTREDMMNLYEVIASARLKIKQFGDASSMLVTKGTQKIKINAVTFGIQRGSAMHGAHDGHVAVDAGEIVEELKYLKALIEKKTSGAGEEEGTGKSVSIDEKGIITIGSERSDAGTSAVDLETKSSFRKIITDLEASPKKSWRPYSEAVSRMLERLTPEQRADLLKDVEVKPFALKLISSLSDDALVKVLLDKIEGKNQTEVKRIITAVGKEKIARVAPELEEKNPHVFEYLAEIGIVLSELRDKLSSSVSTEDLRASLKPYYIMLDSTNPKVREEGLRSLIRLGSRFIEQKNFPLAEEIVVRIASTLGQESVPEVIEAVVEYLSGLYKLSRESKQDKLCEMILEPFSKILGRRDLSLEFRSKIVKFFGSTRSPAVLPTLFSFLWDSGIYPEVRSAIIRFGADAVNEALLTLKEAEDHTLATKLIDILKNIGKGSTELLIDSLEDAGWYLRRNIITVLGEIGDASVAPRLMSYLEDKDDRVRLAVVQAFVQLDYHEGLFKALNDASHEIKTESLKGLKKYISSETVKELLPLLKARGENLHAELLRIIGDKRISEAADAVVEYLRTLEFREDTAAQDLKELAITTLVKSNVWNIKTILQEFKRSKDKQLSSLVAKALEKLT